MHTYTCARAHTHPHTLTCVPYNNTEFIML